MALRRYYEDFDPFNESLKGVWEEEGTQGLSFVDRERSAEGFWRAPKIEAPGHYHFFIHTRTHLVHGEIKRTSAET